ncbi:Lipoprotein-releasing system ATP-binding protein LolD [Austwickia sp. TVS 96-490-7B]|uniref:ABC transporter ATP-binding protein n=1 Tax=Austwickia sp. TVS 96-490-7B TaxID=2830843 RepID=UPI001C57CCC9|nr:ABC transporter ATP-binding protein [Austwickia sp. TVS 96-490-7B]MBW3086809.1 Lipoprotein-releasing system ATP-binding protein LolD [Austwickia sp. TVS 96-490-7B]
MAIKAVKVKKKFKNGDFDRLVVNDISIDIPQGNMVSLMGPSGSGKSTLLKLCAGLEVPDEGSVFINRTRIDRMSSKKRAQVRLNSIGVIFQHGNLLNELTAAENVALPLRAQGHRRLASLQLAQEELESLGLGDYCHRAPETLSGGEQQRVGIARALAGNKKILLADEPTGALDKLATIAVFDALRKVAEAGAAILIATHDPLVNQWVDQSIVIDDGQIVDINYY